MLRRLAINALIALLLLPAAALAAGGARFGADAGTGAGSGAVGAAPLTADEVYWLQYMREEEKLARDVYLALYATWKMPVFSNIAASEQRHMDVVLTLLTR